jgi:light-regulated signal transduction histidine kinase (bacteriophytochrome)
MHFMTKKVSKIAKASTNNLKACKDEQIHLIGTIQPFGSLIGFSKKTAEVYFFGEQIVDLFSISEQELLALKWSDCENRIAPVFSISNWDNLKDGKIPDPTHVTVNQNEFILSFSANDNAIIMECERIDQPGKQYDTHALISGFSENSYKFEKLQEYAQLLAENIRFMTGYDRVMVYRFDEEYNGEVFAEDKINELSPFLGLHYPHTDIPEQARALYKKKHIRMLADVDAKDQHIKCFDDQLEAKDINLSMVNTRGVSTIHLEYMRNMGVAATLTISIMVGEKLWGMVSCHHQRAKKVNFDVRKDVLLMTKVFAGQIMRWEEADEYERVKEKEHIYQSILEEVVKSSDKFEAATQSAYFLGLTEAQGGAVIRGKKIFAFGETPDQEKILEINRWMHDRNEKVFLTNEFSAHSNLGEDIKAIASGILFYSFHAQSKSAMMWFRKQQNEGIKWGGKPETKTAQNRLSPRKSFEAWEEGVNGKSEKWYSHQIQAGLRLGAYLEKEVYISSLKEQKHKLERITDQLSAKNEELSQFNWISSHDMKEPLRKIRLFIDQIRVEEELLSSDQIDYFERIEKSAIRMQNLISDLLDYAKLSKKEAFEIENIDSVIAELKEHFSMGDVVPTIQVTNLPKLEVVRFQMKQLFSNLIGNSIKFRKKDQPCVIKIGCQETTPREISKYHLNQDLEYVKLVFSDNGIGFEKEFDNKVFEVFQRLHPHNNFEGTGIGLAICKKIAHAHQGAISASGAKDKGATFFIFLPKRQML